MEIHLEKRHAVYIALILVAFIAAGFVIAYNPSNSPAAAPATFGHSINELEATSSGCAAGQALVVDTDNKKIKCGTVSGGSSQWTTYSTNNGNNLNYAGGNVGVGRGAYTRDDNFDYFTISRTAAGTDKRAAIQFAKGTAKTFELGVDINVDGGQNFYIYDDTAGGGTRFFIGSTGTVGIGTAGPNTNYKLDVNGPIKTTLLDVYASGGTGYAINVGGNSNNNAVIGFYNKNFDWEPRSYIVRDADNNLILGTTTQGNIHLNPAGGSVYANGNKVLTTASGCHVHTVSSGGNSITAACGTGETLMGGGANCAGSTIVLSEPTDSNGAMSGDGTSTTSGKWSVMCSAANSWNRAFAVCC